MQPASSSFQQPAKERTTAAGAEQKFLRGFSNLDLAAGGQACTLTPETSFTEQAKTSRRMVASRWKSSAAKPGDCAADFGATIQLADLQEMHNQFREQIDSGLKMLADNQVKGVPNEPAASARPIAEGTGDPARMRNRNSPRKKRRSQA